MGKIFHLKSFKTCGISESLNEYIDDKENEEDFEIIDISDKSVDMVIPQAR